MTTPTRAARTFALAAAAALVAGGSLLAAAPAFAADPEPIAVGTVTISGTPKVGEVLTANVADWPVDATLSYQWFYNGGEYGGPIDGETADTYTVDADYIGIWIGVMVTGHVDGFTDDYVSVVLEGAENVVFTDEQPTGPAPVADSSGLPAFLSTNGSTPGTAQSAGLPAGGLASGEDYTARLDWSSPDSFVDVYIYSSPVTIGTFPVVGGVVQVPLGASALASLAPGSHTLVVIGQSSGGVQSYAVSLGLAATGSDLGAAPYAIAGALLLGGVALLAFRRRLTR